MSNNQETATFSLPGRDQRTSIRQRIVLQNLLVVILLAVAAALIFWQVGRLLNAIDTFQTASIRTSTVANARQSSTELIATVTRLLPLEDQNSFTTEVGAVVETLKESEADLAALKAQTEDETILSRLEVVDERINNLINVSETMIRQAAGEKWTNVEVRVGVLIREQKQLALEVGKLVEGVETAEQNAANQVASARRDIILFPALIVLGTALLAGFLIRRTILNIAGPVEKLTESAGQLAAGHLEERVPVTSDDEIGQLALAFNSMAEKLQGHYTSLERRVRERTRDLALAAELGHQLTQLRDLEPLLSEAVERIREHFDLYYTQIYLTDPAGHNLSLYAGTGAIGEELAARGHRLPIDRSSINGAAVTNQEPLIISNTRESDLFRPNPLLPDTRSEMAVPLISGEQVVGVLDLQSDEAESLTPEILPAFEVLAGLLATAIENARLFSELTEAREGLEMQLQERVHDSWSNFLNAIDRAENLGFSYDLTELNPVNEPLPPADGDNALTTPITLGGEPIGAIQIKAARQDWSTGETNLIHSVAQQVAQQVENLRLLAEADRYQAEAEQIMRRMTREGWEQYQETTALAPGYVYDGQVVQPVDQENGHTQSVARAITVQNEPVGDLTILDKDGDLDDESIEILDAVADRLSLHIENLRLNRQTERALADAEQRSEELALLNRVVSEISRTLDLRESLRIVTGELVRVTAGAQARIALLNEERTFLTIVAEEFDSERSPSAMGLEIPVAGNALTEEVLATRETVVVEDAQTDPLTAPIRDMIREQGIETMVVMPILAGNEVIGTVGIDILEDRTFTDEEMRLAENIILQAATSIQNANLFEQVQDALAETERQASRLAELNEMAAALGAAATLEDVFRVAASQTNNIIGGQRTSLTLLNQEKESLELYALEGTEGAIPVGTEVPLEGTAVGLVVQENRPISQPDLREQRYGENAELLAQGLRSTILAPLPGREGVLGTLNVGSTEANAFDSNDITLLQQLASMLATTIENRRLAEQTQAALAETATLYDFSRHLNRATTPEEVLQAITAPALQRAPGSAGLFLLENDDTTQPRWAELMATTASDDDKAQLPVGTRLDLSQLPLTELWLQQGQEVFVEDVANDERIKLPAHPLLDQANVAAIIVLPLQRGGEWLGLVIIRWPQPQTFAERLRRLYSTLREQASLSFERWLLLVETQERARQLQKLASIEAALSTAADEEAILSAVAQTIPAGESARVQLGYSETSEEGKPAKIEIVAGWQEGQISHEDPMVGMTLGLHEMPAINLLLEEPDRILLVEDIENDPRIDEGMRMLSQNMNIGSIAFIPLFSADRWQGAVAFSWPEARTFSADEKFVWRQLLESISAVVASRRAYLAQQEAQEETEALYVASRRINEAGGDLDELVKAVMEAVEIPAVNRGVLVSFEHDPAGELDAVTVTSTWYSGTGPTPSPIGTRFPKETFQAISFIQNDTPLFINDPEQDERIDPPTQTLFHQLQIEAMAVLPLWVGERQLGALLVEANEPHEFSSRQTQAYRTLARQMAVALDNQRLFAQTQEALADAQTLYEASAQLNEARTYDDVLTALRQHTILGNNAQNVSLNYFDRPWTEEQKPEWIQVLTRWSELPADTLQPRYRLSDFPSAEKILTQDVPFIVEDVAGDPRIGDAARTLYANQFGAQSTIFVPLVVGGQWIGYTNAIYHQETRFPEDEVRRLMALAGQAAIAVQSIRLLEDAQNRARREQILRQITAEVRSSTDVDTIMRTAVREIGQALGRDAFIYLEQQTDGTVTEEKA